MRVIPIITAMMSLLVASTGWGQSCIRRPAVTVSPVDEITILDPATNTEFKPTPIVLPGDGGQQVDIPPTVIVHNFYYTGDRDFRGPIFPGGPSIVVVSHPKTGERMYLEVQMLPGSPRVTYRDQYIDYDFGRETIRVRFVHPLKVCDRMEPTVEHRRGDGVVGTAMTGGATARRRATSLLARTGLPELGRGIARGTQGVVHASADVVREAGSIAVRPVVAIVDATPLGSVFNPSPEEKEERRQEVLNRRAEHNPDVDNAFVRTVR
ncbi:MAG: hypothetical protein R3C01_12775 [Planctomycetaceae bacterium]